jgi:hypothetical protein
MLNGHALNKVRNSPMPLHQTIIEASNEIYKAYFKKGDNSPAKVPWTNFKAKEPKYFFQNIYKNAKTIGTLYETKATADNMDYGAWFNYFYAEAKGCQPSDEDCGRIISLIFDLKVTGNGNSANIEIKNNAPTKPSKSFLAYFDTAPAVIPKHILNYLFEFGFEEASTVDASDYMSRKLALASNVGDPVSVKAMKSDRVFCYRGDSRTPDRVKQHNGAICRAELKFWLENAHVNEVWHPWSGNSKLKDKMWFRKGGADNDYYTLNSLAKDFHISCAYPMFRSFEVSQDLRGPVANWDQLKRNKLTSSGKYKIMNVYNNKTQQWEDVITDETLVYICVISGTTKVTKTWELADYPESGVRNVNLRDILAWVKVRRYHVPPKTKLEHYDSTRVSPSMTIKVLSWGWLQSEQHARATLGCTTDGMKTIKAKLDQLSYKVFDISHTQVFIGSRTYSPNKVKPIKIAPRVKLSNW